MPRVGITVYEMLLSCPGDVLDLKDIIEECVSDFNKSLGKEKNIYVELKHWSTDSIPQSGDKPQNLLNKQFINDCDLCVALLGNRFGTPTDNYDSGTQEEIENMIKDKKQVFMYFVERPIYPNTINTEQLDKVRKFRDRYSDRGLFSVVKDNEEFRRKFSQNLNFYFSQIGCGLKKNQRKDIPASLDHDETTSESVDTKKTKEVALNFFINEFGTAEEVDNKEKHKIGYLWLDNPDLHNVRINVTIHDDRFDYFRELEDEFSKKLEEGEKIPAAEGLNYLGGKRYIKRIEKENELKKKAIIFFLRDVYIKDIRIALVDLFDFLNMIINYKLYDEPVNGATRIDCYVNVKSEQGKNHEHSFMVYLGKEDLNALGLDLYKLNIKNYYYVADIKDKSVFYKIAVSFFFYLAEKKYNEVEITESMLNLLNYGVSFG